MTRKLVGFGLIALFAAGIAVAQTYPDRPVRLIAAQSAGSSLDTITRIVTPRLSELLGQQLVIDNRGGAGGIFVPRGTPRAIIAKLHATTQKALAEPDVKQHYANQGLAPLGSASPEEFGRFFHADFARMAKLAKVAGIKPE